MIVTLEPPAEAAEFATQSELSPNYPEALTLAETLQRYVNVYHHHLPQRALGQVHRLRPSNSGSKRTRNCSYQGLKSPGS